MSSDHEALHMNNTITVGDFSGVKYSKYQDIEYALRTPFGEATILEDTQPLTRARLQTLKVWEDTGSILLKGQLSNSGTRVAVTTMIMAQRLKDDTFGADLEVEILQQDNVDNLVKGHRLRKYPPNDNTPCRRRDLGEGELKNQVTDAGGGRSSMYRQEEPAKTSNGREYGFMISEILGHKITFVLKRCSLRLEMFIAGNNVRFEAVAKEHKYIAAHDMPFDNIRRGTVGTIPSITDSSRVCWLDVCEQVRPTSVSFDKQNSYLSEVFSALGIGTTMSIDDGCKGQGRETRISLFTHLSEPHLHVEKLQV
ncbi:hypothetical protein IW262DRAFT_1486562 [Armillaria fumosa]|nr:hypothetical protein IW262DRAFT_1486562 [Armillaria fumosa]